MCLTSIKKKTKVYIKRISLLFLFLLLLLLLLLLLFVPRWVTIVLIRCCFSFFSVLFFFSFFFVPTKSENENYFRLRAVLFIMVKNVIYFPCAASNYCLRSTKYKALSEWLLFFSFFSPPLSSFF